MLLFVASKDPISSWIASALLSFGTNRTEKVVMDRAALIIGLVLGTSFLPGCTHRPEEATDQSSKPTQSTIEINGALYQMPLALSGEGYAIIEGDLIVAEEGALRRRGLSIREAGGLWPKGVVRYKISASLPNRDRVLQAIAEWERKTRIRFVAARAADNDYLLFAPATESTNCSSSVGYRGGQQMLFLGSACRRGHVMHEIGHALGVAHEHMRSDQARYVQIVAANIKDGAEHNFTPKPRKYSDVGPYCYGSIMHYPRHAFSRNGRDTIIPKRSATIGQRTALAQCDIALVEQMYRNEYRKR